MRGTDNAMQGMKPGLPSFFGAVPLLGALSVLSGCAVGPNFTKPQAELAREWHTQGDPRLSTQGEVDTQWWKSFGDPSLDRLVEVAARQNLPLQISGLRIVEARAQLAILTGRQYPQAQALVGSAAAVGRSENSAAANPVDFNLGNIDRHFLEYQLGFDAIWEVDFWGKYRRGVESGTAGLLASVADYQSSLVSLTAEVARTYVLVRTFEVLIVQAQENVRLQEEGYRIAESRFKNGVTSELDVMQAATLLESTRATIPQLQAGLEQARNAMSTLLGQPTGQVEALLAGPKQIPVAPATVAVGMPAEILRRRPDVRGAELYAAAQCARIGVAEAELYPSFSLFGTVGLQASTSAAASGNLFSLGSLFYSVGPRVVFPFLNYGRLKNGVRVEDARFQQLLVNYRNTVLKAAQEVADALTGFIHAQQTQAFQQGAVKAAQRSVELALVQYREGAVDYQRVLDAQRSLLEQQNNLAQTSSSIATNLVALYKALGGGWEVRRNQPVVPEPMQAEMEQRTHWGDMLSTPRTQETKTVSQPVKP
ncbi:efflux transporter outer membrane subunit [Corallococcus interemptor]|uniref:efflux transporter outer membrane subunit n=1 Tax=Corallococcus interemptor TaxID=2316720 RepID=UPI003D090A4B